MKTSMKLILGLLFITFPLQNFAQKPEPVYSIVRQIHDFDWYQQQARAWKQEIDNGTTNKMAWVYWFRANRMATFSNKEKWDNNQGNYFMPQDKLLKLAEKAIPNTFELYFLEAYINGSYTPVGSENIMKAQAINPFATLILPDLLNHYEFENDKANIELTCKKWFESNEMPQEILITAYNNLISLDPNAILIVYGDNDTYPSWILQNVQKIRPDVMVLNISLALIDPYRERLFKEYGIPQLSFQNNSDRTTQTIVKHLIENVHNKSIYISVYASQDIYKDYVDKMYLTGMSFKYSEKPFDNLAVLQNNFENKFMLDFLKLNFYYNYAQSVVNQMNSGYLVVFLKLYEHYLLCGETVKAQNVKELAITVSKNAGNNDWLKYFEK
ncbi:MAG: hypothetical protein ACYC25_09335 [Paludibacter sp.]